MTAFSMFKLVAAVAAAVAAVAWVVLATVRSARHWPPRNSRGGDGDRRILETLPELFLASALSGRLAALFAAAQ